jgi:exopolysaccharide biosynthesis polyprenyl glycosylphosphotransferase
VAALLAIGAAREEPWTVEFRLAFLLVFAPILWIALFRAFGLYRFGQSPGWDSFRRLLGATGAGVIILMVLAPWSIPPSRSVLASSWLLILCLEVIARGLFRRAVSPLMSSDRLALRTAIVGTGRESQELAHAFASDGRGYAAIGYLSLEPGPSGDGLPILGSLSDLDAVIARDQIECVFVPPAIRDADDVISVSRACRRANIEMRVWADVPSILAGRASFQPMHDMTALVIKPVRFTRSRAAIKRSFDVILASVALVVAAPFLLAVAIAIRSTSRGSAFFRQQRVTKDGRVFEMFKFRTMVDNAEQALEGKTIDLTQPFFKIRDDPRLTRVGRVLRRWSLDELPQLLNVFRGEMSMVGPRPLPVEQVAANLDFLAPRHDVRCGITGWWQISGRSEIDSEEALRLDQYYIENWSVGLDIYILLRTLGTVLTRKGAW